MAHLEPARTLCGVKGDLEMQIRQAAEGGKVAQLVADENAAAPGPAGVIRSVACGAPGASKTLGGAMGDLKVQIHQAAEDGNVEQRVADENAAVSWTAGVSSRVATDAQGASQTLCCVKCELKSQIRQAVETIEQLVADQNAAVPWTAGVNRVPSDVSGASKTLCGVKGDFREFKSRGPPVRAAGSRPTLRAPRRRCAASS